MFLSYDQNTTTTQFKYSSCRKYYLFKKTRRGKYKIIYLKYNCESFFLIIHMKFGIFLLVKKLINRKKSIVVIIYPIASSFPYLHCIRLAP